MVPVCPLAEGRSWKESCAVSSELVHHTLYGSIRGEILGAQILHGEWIGAVLLEPLFDVGALVSESQDGGYRVRVHLVADRAHQIMRDTA